MDALSTSVTSTLKVSAPNLLSTSSTHHLRTPLLHPQQSRRASLSTSSPRASFSHASLSAPSPSRRRPSSTRLHKRAATGYAAALLDIARCNDSLDRVERDVRRFSRLLGNEQIRAVQGEAEKGRVVREVAERGRFDKSLVGLVKMLVEKNKDVGLVAEVMEEFERIYDELAGTSVVVVSSPAKMEREELFGIARRVQMISGAAKVKVKNLIGVDESQSTLTPSFAF